MIKKVAKLSQNGNLNVNGEIVEIPELLRSGRNLLKDSQKITMAPNSTGTGKALLMNDEEIPYHRVIADDGKVVSMYYWYKVAQSQSFKVPNKFTISVDLRPSIEANVSISSRDNISPYDSNYSENVLVKTNEWKRIFLTIDYSRTDEGNNRLIAFSGVANQIDYRNWKIELGTKSTSWSPAPEDLNSNIPNWVESAEQPFSMKEEGLITHEMIEIPDELVGTGGRNLLKNSNFERGMTPREFMYFVDAHKSFENLVGQVVTISFDAKASKNGFLQVYGTNNARYYFDVNVFNITTEYKRYSLTETIRDRNNGKTVSWIDMYSSYDSGVFSTVKNLKIEKGYKVTPYSPAPEDLGIVLPDSIQNFDNPMSVGSDGITLSGEYSEVPDTLRFNKTNYIEANNPLYNQSNLEQEWTVEAVFKMDSSANAGQFLIDGINMGLRISHASTPLMYLNSGIHDYYSYGKKDCRDGKLHHVSFVFKNQTSLKSIFIDGNDITNYEAGPNKTNTPSGMSKKIGIGIGMVGCLSYVRIWDRAMTLNEIKELVGKHTPSNIPNLVGYWKIDEGYGDTIKDHSNNLNHGTVIKGTEWVYSMNEEGGI